MKPVPRPPARLLLAGRFVVSRVCLHALPDGPVVALDLTFGGPVSLVFGPPGVDAAELATRIERWNAVERDGSPAVRDLRWHLGRSLLVCEPPASVCAWPVRVVDTSSLVARAAALGARLDAADLGLPAGPSRLALGASGVLLQRPAVWLADPARPLARALAADVPALVAAHPEPAAVPARRTRPVRGSRRPPRAILLRHLPRRTLGVGLVAAAGLAAAVVAATVVAGPHGTPVTALALARTRPAATARVVPLRIAHVRRRARSPALRPTSRGGAARVLVASPPPRQRSQIVGVLPARRTRPAPARGWVDGLFVS